MQPRSIHLTIFICLLSIAAWPVVAKDGVHATVHTVILAHAQHGTQLRIIWILANKDSGKPFNACNVFIRLIGSTGESTEAFASCGTNSDGRYSALAIIPEGGVDAIEIGVAGTLTDPRSGHSERSDWLMPLANDPIRE